MVKSYRMELYVHMKNAFLLISDQIKHWASYAECPTIHKHFLIYLLITIVYNGKRNLWTCLP